MSETTVDAAREARYPLAAQWDDSTRRLEVGGRVVISQTPTDPGDIGEPRVSVMDDTTYVSVPEFELWPTDSDWEPHDATIVYITRRSFTLNAPGKMTYHRPNRHTRYSDRTGCGIDIWSSGWEPTEQSSLVAVRRDVASRIARPCHVCGADR